MTIKRIAFVSDLQVPFFDEKATKSVGRFLAKWKPQRTICIGDEIDLPQLGGFNAGTIDEMVGNEPPAGAAQAGTPPTTVKTLPVDPIPSLVLVFAVDERYSISPRVVEGFKFLVVVSTDEPSVLIADAPSLTNAVSSGVVQP